MHLDQDGYSTVMWNFSSCIAGHADLHWRAGMIRHAQRCRTPSSQHGQLPRCWRGLRAAPTPRYRVNRIQISSSADFNGSISSGSEDDEGSSDGVGEDFAGAIDPTGLWEPPPPSASLGRKRKVALLLGAAMLEVAMTGGLRITP
jgi:hypothetical protein